MARYRFAWLTAVATWLLLIAGSLVTSTDSGLAVPDWPLSYGMWFPPMVGGILYEHGHRMVAAVVGLMTLALAIWLWKAEGRRWVRWLGLTALVAVVVQALLGGVAVVLLLPSPISMVHACVGQAVFCLVVCVARALSPSWQGVSARGEAQGTVWRLGMVVSALLIVQLLLGATVRHTGQALLWHVVTALVLLLAIGWLTARLTRQRQQLGGALRSSWRLLLGLLVQFGLGMAVFVHRGSVVLRTAHVAFGAIVLAQAVVLAWELVRSAAPAPGLRRRLLDYLELTKPRLSALVLLTTAVGFWLGMRGGVPIGRFVMTLMGTMLVVGGANALNQWMERDADALMERTRQRPLPAGRLRPESAYVFGLLLVVFGVVDLALGVNAFSAALALAACAVYLFVYTPMKRRSALCTLIGAIPGALPPVIGWAGTQHRVGSEAGVLFAILFVWQLVHFLGIAMLYRADYARAGFRMLPLVESDGLSTARQLAFSGLALIPASLFPTPIGLAGAWYFFGALALSLAFLAMALWAALMRSVPAYRQLFRTSVLYLPLLLMLLAADKRTL